MNRITPSSVAVLLALTLTAPHAHAFCVPLPCYPFEVVWVDKVVTCYRTETCVRAVPCVVQRQVCHEETYVEKYAVAVPEWSEQKREVYVYRTVPKEVEREVTVLLPAPPCPAPCGDGHGSCSFCNRPTPATTTTKIKCIEQEAAPEKVTFTEKVCTYKAEQRTRLAKRQVVQTIAETVMRQETVCERVPYTITIKVPVCLSVAPCQ